MFKSLVTLITLICVFCTGFVVGKFIFPSKQVAQTTVKIDPVVIVQKIQSLSKLETVEMILTRNIDINLDLGSIDIFGFSLDKKRTQKIALTGKVVAGMDLSSLTVDKIQLDKDSNLIIDLPASSILYTQVDENKTQLLRDDLSLLYKFDNISDQKRLELNETLRKQVAIQTKNALSNGACEDDILVKAGENAKKEMQRLFTFSSFKQIQVNVEESKDCSIKIELE
jgi:hypothetical protein